MVIEEKSVELALCPFCGSEAKLKSDGFYSKFLGGNEKRDAYFWAKCENRECAASIKSQSTKESAISKWNERV